MHNIVLNQENSTGYSTEFKQLVSNCLNSKSYVGIGNPNAQILLIGKEAAIDSSNPLKHTDYLRNSQHWCLKIENNIYEDYKFASNEPGLKRIGHTWRKYQQLHDSIFNTPAPPIGEFNFLEKIFTTEMSDFPKLRTRDAQNSTDFWLNLEERKNSFFKSSFIQSFPIVVLACHNYIWNDKRGNQMKNIFDAQYINCIETMITKKPQKFYIHRTTNNRLIIHTNQLSGSVASKELIEKLGTVIRDFGIERNLFVLK